MLGFYASYAAFEVRVAEALIQAAIARRVHKINGGQRHTVERVVFDH